MGFSTQVTRRLGIRHPIIQGGMHYVGYAPLAAAVSEAGGLGMVTALTQPDAVALREEIRKCKSLTDKPFGVNLTLLPMLVPPDYEAYADAVVDEGVKVVETAGHYKGLEPFIKKFKEHDINIIHKCTQVRHAKTAEKMGVDMVTIDGFEAAGHPGEADVGNWVLFPKAAQELNVPWIACGGNATGSQLAAALALGAEGICMGTRFMATKEAPIHDNIKRALVDGDEHSTALIMRTMRNTERVYKNRAVEELMEIEANYPGDFEKIKHLVSGRVYAKVFQETGNIDEGVWSAGVVMGLINDIPTCEQLVDNIINDAVRCVDERLRKLRTS
mmetsp:Transcript_19392/g.31922  ORF Transcript_19392/g.31922 Transcript_19392/m.31922 type:complete len:330 (-) Transcript_19392:1749-2738(-)|eukprot:CAMPEP_0203770186 /NCGR_PEP_ID=MMETSP0099_2-20121227/2643_1 /ASSEMBLY_ACC=CAM_ASM_000209 /TAXON_ID=96639 /ORGANISM=" , Strain NY0313808BC1" /LENGTH=329 /DNA_ID=CAMNT_0050667239 /DNA_START=269 /DNA_END=1258 /DNA_ORIENTATION=+